MVPLTPHQSTAIRPCVLIIDDEENVRIALRAILQSEYDILEADSADHGMEILKHHHADLVTMDVLMPGQSGLDALRTLRRSTETSSLPVIMITGHGSLDSACEALRLGATDYLQKPFGVDELKTSIRNGLLRTEAPATLAPAAKNGHAEKHQPKVPREDQVRGETDEDLVRLGKASAAFVHDLASPLQVLTFLNSLCFQKLTSEVQGLDLNEDLLNTIKQMEQLLVWSTELVKGWQSIAMPCAPKKEVLDVDAMLDRVTKLVMPYAQLNGVTVTRLPLAAPMRVEGDRTQLERALVNICLNGIKASTTRGRTLEMGAIAFAPYTVFRFSDSGQGFSPERMKEVLESDPFSPGGTKRRGLGLFIADWIAMNHGGKLQFISDKGQGTTVELFLPT
jgi:DNA-binding response OmpR family regulator